MARSLEKCRKGWKSPNKATLTDEGAESGLKIENMNNNSGRSGAGIKQGKDVPPQKSTRGYSHGVTKSGEEALFVSRTDLINTAGGLSTSTPIENICRANKNINSKPTDVLPSVEPGDQQPQDSNGGLQDNQPSLTDITSSANQQQLYTQQDYSQHYADHYYQGPYHQFTPNSMYQSHGQFQYPYHPYQTASNYAYPPDFGQASGGNGNSYFPQGNDRWNQSGYSYYQDSNEVYYSNQPQFQYAATYGGQNCYVYEPRITATAVTPSGHRFTIPLDESKYEVKSFNNEHSESPKPCDLHKLETEGDSGSDNRFITSPRPIQNRNSDEESDDAISYGEAPSESPSTPDSSENDYASDATDKDIPEIPVFTDKEYVPVLSPTISIVEEMFRNAIPGQTVDSLDDDHSTAAEDGCGENTIESDGKVTGENQCIFEADSELSEMCESWHTLIANSNGEDGDDEGDGDGADQANVGHITDEDSTSDEDFSVTVNTTDIEKNIQDNLTTDNEVIISNATEVGRHEIGENSYLLATSSENSTTDSNQVILNEAFDSQQWVTNEPQQFSAYDTHSAVAGQYGQYDLNYAGVSVAQYVHDYHNQYQFQMPPMEILYPQQWSSQTAYVDPGNAYGSQESYQENPGKSPNAGATSSHDNGMTKGIDLSLVDPEDGLAYPALHVSDEGLITVILRKGVFLEMTVDRALRLVNHDKHLVVAMNAEGDSACILHPAARMLQTERAIDVELYQDRRAHMTADTVIFGNNRNTYRFDNRIATELHTSPNYCDLSEDWSVSYLDSTNAFNGFCNWETMARCKDITSKAYFEKITDNACKVIINGVKVIQNEKGETSVFFGPIKFMRMSPDHSVLRVKTHFFEADVEPNWNVKIHRGAVSLNATCLGLTLSNGRIKACLDSDNTFQAFDLPSHKRLNLGQPVQQRRPGVVPRRKYVSLDNGYGRETDHEGYPRRY